MDLYIKYTDVLLNHKKLLSLMTTMLNLKKNTN